VRIQLQLSIGERTVEKAFIEIDDRKLEELTPEELEGAIEMNVRTWADRNIRLDWEVIDKNGEGNA
jgi:hypothetical protein